MSEGKDNAEWYATLTRPENHWRLAAIIVIGTLYAVLTVWLALHLFDALKAGAGEDDGKFEGIRNLGLIFVAAVGAPFVLYRTHVLGKQARIADTQAQLAEDRSFSDLFTKAVEQLGADKVVKSHAKTKDDELAYDANGVPIMQEVTAPNIEVRLGAIYALQRISRASEKDHIPIMETLCAYIRENATEGEPEEFPGKDLPNKDDMPLDAYLSRIEARTEELREFWSPVKPLRSDIRAVMTVIADRAEHHAYEDANKYRLDLRRANLQRADLVGVDLANADLREARLEGANLFDAKMDRANLSGAKTDRANLNGAKMEGADLRGAKMDRANLIRAEMEGANLRYAKMEGANLSYANFKSAKLALCNNDSVNASFADFTQTEGLTPATLNRCFGCAGTKLPDGLSHPDHWHPTELEDWDAREETYQTWLTERKAKRLPPFDEEPD